MNIVLGLLSFTLLLIALVSALVFGLFNGDNDRDSNNEVRTNTPPVIAQNITPTPTSSSTATIEPSNTPTSTNTASALPTNTSTATREFSLTPTAPDTPTATTMPTANTSTMIVGTVGTNTYSYIATRTNTPTAATQSNTLLLDNLDSVTQIASINHQGGARSISWSPNGQLLASTGLDGFVRIYDVTVNKEIRSFKSHRDWSSSLEWSPNGSFLAVGGWRTEPSIIVFETNNWSEYKILRGHSDTVGDLSWSPNSEQLVSTSDDFTVKIWDIYSGQEIRTLTRNEGRFDVIISLDWSQDGNYIAMTSLDDKIRIWNTFDDYNLQIAGENEIASLGVAWSQFGLYLASGGGDGIILVLHPFMNGVETIILEGHNNAVYSVDWSTNPNGLYLASGSVDKTIKIWNIGDGNSVITLAEHTGSVYDVAFSPEGLYLASASEDGTVRIWGTNLLLQNSTSFSRN